ncbi:MAG TPA: hypothetical protein VF572_01750 [Candidatus Saccharimonadales bacterium]|jgi:hypothetical protein
MKNTSGVIHKESYKPQPARREPSAAWRTAAVFVLAAGFTMWLWSVSEQIMRQALTASLLIVGMNLAIAAVAALAVTGLLAVTLGRFKRVPKLYIWSVLTVLIMLGTSGAGASPKAWALFIVLLVVTMSIIGGVVGSLRSDQWKLFHSRARLTRLVAAGVALLAVLVTTVWLVSPGSTDKPSGDKKAAAAHSDMPNPATQGTFEVRTLTYGSGNDRQRPDYRQVAIRTSSVDASEIITGWSGFSGNARTKMWGFDATKLPLNGRVWYPAADGKFPLVLIVHGNNSAVQFSDSGFAYLGNLLASRGYIVASVDENFLNTGLIDKMGGLANVNAARGWILLEHLSQWRDWSSQPGNPFNGKVDMDHIALMGHSRGGEAIAIAADFNNRTSLPENKDVIFKYGFSIKSLIALAPSDAQYLPDGKKIKLTGVNYMVLQGAQDADVTTFGGLNQYQRTQIGTDPDSIKSAVYIAGANHGQFNSDWGRHDIGQGVAKHFLRTGNLLASGEQQKIAQVYTSTFLDKTLRGSRQYDGLLQAAARSQPLLPQTDYTHEYSTGSTTYVQDFEGDVVPSARSAVGKLQLRGGPGDSKVLRLGSAGGGAQGLKQYSVELPAAAIQKVTLDSVLRFDAALESRVPRTAALQISLRDGSGRVATLKSLPAMELRQPIDGQYIKLKALQPGLPHEPVLQTHSVPLAASLAGIPDFDISQLRSITVTVPDDLPAGVLLDNIGIDSARPI